MKTKTIVISIVIIAALIGGVIVLSRGKGNSSNDAGQAANNVSTTDGKQIITIDAKGGYSPKATTAKADTPTIIKVATNGTYDCSSALTIPSLKYRTNLPPSGVTDIEVPPQKAGTKLQALCAMGMYNFAVSFN